jgi:hypothetical protein
MGAGDLYTANSVQIWVKNGNKRAEKLVRSWEESEFQSTLKAQHSKDYEMEVEQYIAALGARGDEIIIKVPCTATDDGAAVAKGVEGHLFVDFEDILGVPADVQLAKIHGYGKYSPFDSPDLKVTDEMKRGIEAEKLALVLNAAVTSATYVSQKIAGEADSRLQARWAKTLVVNTDETFELRLKPSSTNVFLIRYDSRIWVLPSVKSTTNAFYEKTD